MNLLFKSLCLNQENLLQRHNLILQICMSHSSAGTNFFNDKTETLLVKNLGTKEENGVKYLSLLKRVSLYIISAFHSPDVQESIVEERSSKWNSEMMYRNHFLSGKKQGTNFFHFLCLRPCMLLMPYGVDVSHWPASHPIFSCWVG